MNNKGQSLVLFVLLIPLVFLLLFMVYEIGRMTLLRHELDNINMIATDYGITKMNDDNAIDKVKELIVKNNSEIDNISINIEDNKIYITLEDKLDMNVSLFKNVFVVKSAYVGYMENDKKVIKKDK